MATDRALAFLFSAQGSQWAGMGRALWHDDTAFRDAIARCDASLRRHVTWSLCDELLAEPKVWRLHREVRMVQPCLTSLQLALVVALAARGVKPGAVGALSMGEAAAAHVAGVLTLDEALDVACATARLAETELRPGRMAFVRQSWAATAALLEEPAAAGPDGEPAVLAVELGRELTVISGEAGAVGAALALADRRGIATGTLPLAQAYHSPDVASLGRAFEPRLARLRPRPATLRAYSSVTGAGAPPFTAGHGWQICSSPARFYTMALAMIDDGQRRFVEIGPHPMLAQTLEEAAVERGVAIEVRPAMRRGGSELGALARWSHRSPEVTCAG